MFRLGAGGGGGASGHGASHRSLLSHHFRLWREARQPRIAPSRERSKGPRGVSPWPRGEDFAWNMWPSEQRLHPTPALPEQSQERWVMGVQVGGPNGGTANPVSCVLNVSGERISRSQVPPRSKVAILLRKGPGLCDLHITLQKFP